ncbi:hypothetical protein [Pseudomonas khavaziana]|uniref:hypothetical protein n=1 Tax=Pseudomonas khavaziana TaxID=2842351 RepID=UPI001C3CBCA9|nr:hypothetical protein [Pseudomonas khavaziana]MBV4481797.1 hypothetical protein [Pseudomonas khavaziana]
MDNTIKRPMFIVGASLLAVGLATSIPGIWIPGIVFMGIGVSQKPRTDSVTQTAGEPALATSAIMDQELGLCTTKPTARYSRKYS